MILNSERIKYCLFSILFLCLSCNDKNSKISKNYNFFIDSGYGEITGENVISQRANIYPNVIDFKFDEKFVIVKQVPNKEKYRISLGRDLYNIYLLYSYALVDGSLDHFKNSDSIIYSNFKSKGATINNEIEDIGIGQQIADSIINNDSFYKKIFSKDTNYWIIHIPNDSLIGPLNKLEFESTSKKLRISTDLELD